jgi:hypothetical protein
MKMRREERIKEAYSRMTDEELEATLERAEEMAEEAEETVRSGPAESETEMKQMMEATTEAKEAKEEVNRALSEQEWRQFPTPIQAETDLSRYMHEIGVGDYAEGINQDYKEILEAPLQQGTEPETLIAAVLRDRYWLQHDEVPEELDVSETAIRGVSRDIGLDPLNTTQLERRVEAYEEKFGGEYGEIIEEYSKKVPNARPEEMAAVMDVATSPEYMDASLEDAAEYFDADLEGVERAAEYFERETGQKV